MYRAPTKPYTIYRGTPFEVLEQKDIDFFDESHRFKRVLFKSTVKPVEKEEDKSEEFYAELEAIRGISENAARKIVDIYQTKDNLMQVLEQNLQIDPKITKRQHTYLRKEYLEVD